MADLIKSPSSGTVYLLQNGQKLPIAGPWVLQANGWSFNDVKTVPDTTLNRYPTGALLNTQPSQTTTASSSPSDPNQATAQTIQDSMDRAISDYFAKAKEYDTKNPFAFDEALATKAGQERVSPYYDQKLGDFLQGIETNRRRSSEDQQNVLTQIQQDTDAYEGRNKFLLDRALRQSQEGQADAGLFDSGSAKAASGEINVENNQNLSDFLRGQGRRIENTNLNASRTAQDLNLQQSQGTRDINQNKAFDVQQFVGDEKLRQQRQSEFERLQYLGPVPGESPQSYDSRRFSVLGL